MLRTCTKCACDKHTGDFYSVGGQCKECVKANVRAYRAKNIEAIRQYDRDRGADPERMAANAARRHRYKQAPSIWRNRNPEKYKCHVALNNALRAGQVVRAETCEKCAETKVEAHHEDYSRPLEVRWLCRVHHAARHKEINEMNRQASASER